ncbi:MAG: DUF4357 domain-containing protein [candidate division WOR-3 bacterium]
MRKKFKGQLVCQHIEKISRKLLEKYPEVIKQFVRGRHGIYALYRGNRLYYVGLASNLRSRLRRHLRDRHGQTWDRFSVYLTLSDSHLHELESLVLRIASPRGNLLGGKFLRSQDLKHDVLRKIREIQKQEQIELLGEEPVKVESKKLSSDKTLGALAPYVTKRFHIRLNYKGKVYIAHVRKDGWITFDARSPNFKKFKGKRFKSPSAAAQAISGHSMDGWKWWKYQRSPGEWVCIDELRKK